MGNRHIVRLDSIRILAAVWVAISHGAIPLKPLVNSGFFRLVLASIQDSFDGVAAVMVFFIVSGLCIHLPYSGKSSVPLTTFLIRRYLRVGLPLAVVLAAAPLAGADAEARLKAVTWSVYAELFYYSVYPILFPAAKRWGWTLQISISALISIVISFWFLRETHLISLGWFVWLWGLPIWMSGCLVADWFRDGLFPAMPGSLWQVRALAWIVSVASTWLVFHSPIKIGYQFTMLAFALVALVWLVKELTTRIKTWNALEICGAASYSLYLTHPVTLGALAQHGPALPTPIDLFMRVGMVVITTIVFYFFVEAPSHWLARTVSRAVASRAAKGSKAMIDFGA